MIEKENTNLDLICYIINLIHFFMLFLTFLKCLIQPNLLYINQFRKRSKDTKRNFEMAPLSIVCFKAFCDAF